MSLVEYFTRCGSWWKPHEWSPWERHHIPERIVRSGTIEFRCVGRVFCLRGCQHCSQTETCAIAKARGEEHACEHSWKAGSSPYQLSGVTA